MSPAGTPIQLRRYKRPMTPILLPIVPDATLVLVLRYGKCDFRFRRRLHVGLARPCIRRLDEAVAVSLGQVLSERVSMLPAQHLQSASACPKSVRSTTSSQGRKSSPGSTGQWAFLWRRTSTIIWSVKYDTISGGVSLPFTAVTRLLTPSRSPSFLSSPVPFYLAIFPRLSLRLPTSTWRSVSNPDT